MKARAWLLALAAPFVAPSVGNAQITLSTLVGTTQTPVGSSYNFGSFAPSVQSPLVTFVMTNIGTSPVTVCKFGISSSGPGSSPSGGFVVNSPTPSYNQASAPDFFVQFTGGPVGTYTANLAVYFVLGSATCGSPQQSTQPILLIASVVQASTLTVSPPCTGPDAGGNISFGRIPQTQQVTCTFTLANTYTQALTISPIAVLPSLSGAGFQTPQASSATIPAGQSLVFPVIFTAAAASAYTGTLTVGVQTYYLSGTGYLSPLPAPILSFNASTLQSGTQYLLTAALPSPAQAAANGSITLSFTPSATLNGAALTDDPAVQFVGTGNRVVSFSVAQGSTTVLLNNQSDVIFSTGTTAGTITFTVDAGAIGISGNTTTTATIAPAPINVTAASATTETADLAVSVTGFDNTYSIGAMTFTFYDVSGKQLGAPIQANFSPQFQSFYQGQTKNGVSAGSAFLMQALFPVTGNEAAVGSVSIQLNNTAGTTTVSGLNFP